MPEIGFKNMHITLRLHEVLLKPKIKNSKLIKMQCETVDQTVKTIHQKSLI